MRRRADSHRPGVGSLYLGGADNQTAAKAYRLLRAILNTAVDDGLIRRNPCRVKGADKETSPERPVLTVAQVFALAAAIGRATVRWSCWPPSPVSAGPNSPRFASKISTWTPARSG